LKTVPLEFIFLIVDEIIYQTSAIATAHFAVPKLQKR